MPHSLDPLLDEASLGEVPPGVIRAVLLAEAMQHTREVLGDLVAPASDPDLDTAVGALTATGDAPLPAAAQAVWTAAYERLGWKVYRDRKFQRGLARRVGAERRPEIAMPLLRASLHLGMSGISCGSPLGVAIAIDWWLNDGGDPAMLIRELSGHHDLCFAARGALWLAMWAIPGEPARTTWLFLARAGEPAAVGALLDAAMVPVPPWQLPPREATTRALVRIIRRQDPWVEQLWDERDGTREPTGPRVVQAAVTLLPAVVVRAGGGELAREALRAMWPAPAPASAESVAIALAQLGDATGLDALLAAVAAPTAGLEPALLGALGTLGPQAAAAVPGLERRWHPGRYEQAWIAATLAAIVPADPRWLDRLAGELVGESFTSRVAELHDHMREGLITHEELAAGWVEVAVRALALWTHDGRWNPARLAAVEYLATAMVPEVDYLGHPALAALPSSLAAIRAEIRDPRSTDASG